MSKKNFKEMLEIDCTKCPIPKVCEFVKALSFMGVEQDACPLATAMIRAGEK